MKKILIFLVFICYSCGIINDTTEETYLFTFNIINKTGQDLLIGIEGDQLEMITNDETISCVTEAFRAWRGALCNGRLIIQIPSTSTGYLCMAGEDNGLCFADQRSVFSIDFDTIYTETSTRTYEYTLTPEFLEGVFELPNDSLDVE